MQLNSKQLQTWGAIMPRSVIKKTIQINRPVPKAESEWEEAGSPEFTDETVEENWDIFVQRGTSADGLEIMRASERDQPFLAVYRCVVNEDGSSFFESLEQAQAAALWLIMPMFRAVADEVIPGKKRQRRAISGGANSRSRSAVARSKNGKKP